MRQPTEYSVESTNGLTAARGFASDCILKGREGGKRTTPKPTPNHKR